MLVLHACHENKETKSISSKSVSPHYPPENELECFPIKFSEGMFTK